MSIALDALFLLSKDDCVQRTLIGRQRSMEVAAWGTTVSMSSLAPIFASREAF